jgi:hypothetical protein
MGNFSAGLPTHHQKIQMMGSGRQWQNLPNYSYGLAGDFHTLPLKYARSPYQFFEAVSI